MSQTYSKKSLTVKSPDGKSSKSYPYDDSQSDAMSDNNQNDLDDNEHDSSEYSDPNEPVKSVASDAKTSDEELDSLQSVSDEVSEDDRDIHLKELFVLNKQSNSDKEVVIESSYQSSPEEQRKLRQMLWDREFEVYDLDAD